MQATVAKVTIIALLATIFTSMAMPKPAEARRTGRIVVAGAAVAGIWYLLKRSNRNRNVAQDQRQWATQPSTTQQGMQWGTTQPGTTQQGTQWDTTQQGTMGTQQGLADNQTTGTVGTGASAQGTTTLGTATTQGASP